MPDLERFPDNVWDRFFEFVVPCEEPATLAEVDEELRQLGIDPKKAVSKVHQVVQAARARTELENARAKRLRVAPALGRLVPPAGAVVREKLGELIGRLHGGLQQAYFRKLEAAASDEDLRSLWEDMCRLEVISGEGTDDNAGTE